MSTRQIYIAQLRKWVDLDIPAIEGLIDAVNAYDERGVSVPHRVDPSVTSTEQGLTLDI